MDDGACLAQSKRYPPTDRSRWKNAPLDREAIRKSLSSLECDPHDDEEPFVGHCSACSSPLSSPTKLASSPWDQMDSSARHLARCQHHHTNQCSHGSPQQQAKRFPCQHHYPPVQRETPADLPPGYHSFQCAPLAPISTIHVSSKPCSSATSTSSQKRAPTTEGEVCLSPATSGVESFENEEVAPLRKVKSPGRPRVILTSYEEEYDSSIEAECIRSPIGPNIQSVCHSPKQTTPVTCPPSSNNFQSRRVGNLFEQSVLPISSSNMSSNVTSREASVVGSRTSNMQASLDPCLDYHNSSAGVLTSNVPHTAVAASAPTRSSYQQKNNYPVALKQISQPQSSNCGSQVSLEEYLEETNEDTVFEVERHALVAQFLTAEEEYVGMLCRLKNEFVAKSKLRGRDSVEFTANLLEQMDDISVMESRLVEKLKTHFPSFALEDTTEESHLRITLPSVSDHFSEDLLASLRRNSAQDFGFINVLSQDKQKRNQEELMATIATFAKEKVEAICYYENDSLTYDHCMEILRAFDLQTETNFEDGSDKKKTKHYHFSKKHDASHDRLKKSFVQGASCRMSNIRSFIMRITTLHRHKENEGQFSFLLSVLNEMDGLIFNCHKNPKQKITAQRSALLWQRLKTDSDMGFEMDYLGKLQMSGALHVLWRSFDGSVKSQYMGIFLFDCCLVLATVQQHDKYHIKCIISLSAFSVEDSDNSFGLKSSASFTFKIVFESDFALYEVMATASSTEEEYAWRTMLESKGCLADNDYAWDFSLSTLAAQGGGPLALPIGCMQPLYVGNKFRVSNLANQKSPNLAHKLLGVQQTAIVAIDNYGSRLKRTDIQRMKRLSKASNSFPIFKVTIRKSDRMLAERNLQSVWYIDRQAIEEIARDKVFAAACNEHDCLERQEHHRNEGHSDQQGNASSLRPGAKSSKFYTNRGVGGGPCAAIAKRPDSVISRSIDDCHSKRESVISSTVRQLTPLRHPASSMRRHLLVRLLGRNLK